MVIRRPSQSCVMGTPSMYSMTKYGRPLGVAPASRIRAIFGWSITARFALFGEVHGAHAPLADWAKDVKPAEVLIAAAAVSMVCVWDSAAPSELSKAPAIRHFGRSPAGSSEPGSSPRRF